MIKLQKPADNAKDTFELCISRVKNADLRLRLNSITPNIEAYATTYEAAAKSARLHTLLSHDNVNGIVTQKEMEAVYTGRMAKKGQPGRGIYDKIMQIPKHDICPLCNQRLVATLDHHLPKSTHPSLAVVPANLIAACSDCNKIKLDITSVEAEKQTLHPYFDDVSTEVWLIAELMPGSPSTLKFAVRPPATWDRVLAQRLVYHFSTLKLARLYSSHSGSELVNQRVMLNRLFTRGGPGNVRAHLEDSAETYESVNANSWQSAMYRALAASDWYCGGGFSQT